MSRERFASRIGFIFLSAGCAIGLGNVWRFPYVVGANGGGGFVAIYLICLALIGLPVLVMEFATGRAAQRSIVSLHRALTPERPAWRVHGIAGMVGNIVLMMFYAVITGWMGIYCIRMQAGLFKGLDGAGVADVFEKMLGDPLKMAVVAAVHILGAGMICAFGLRKGLERVTKFLMGGLLVLIVALAVNSLRLDGAGRGLAFYLVPDFAVMRTVGVGKVIVEAMNQAFFTLSLGIGAMSIFGSYLGRDRTLLGEAVNVCALDTFVALMAGLIILPACFACGVEPGQGPRLIFVTLPLVFRQMPLGTLWGTLFFLFMTLAAFTTVLAVFETILACLCEMTGLSRRAGCPLLTIALILLSLPCVLGFNVWSSFQPFGPGSGVLDLEDFFVSNLLLPLGGLAFAFYCTRRYGWGWTSFLAEANAGQGPRFPAGRCVRFYCAWILPAFILVIFVLGLWGRLAK